MLQHVYMYIMCMSHDHHVTEHCTCGVSYLREGSDGDHGICVRVTLDDAVL